MAFIWSRLAPFFNPRVSRTAVQGRSRKCGGEPIMDPRQRLTQSETLSAALRLIRSHRRLKASEVADRMNMAQRSYEHFEAGAGRVNLERIHRFADATDSDPYALLASLGLGSPEFALRCADNKLMTIIMVALQDFDRDRGDVAAALDSRTLINAFDRAFKDLGDLAVQRDQDARAWLAEGLDRLVRPPKPDEA